MTFSLVRSSESLKIYHITPSFEIRKKPTTTCHEHYKPLVLSTVSGSSQGSVCEVLLPDRDCHVSSAGLATDSDYYRHTVAGGGPRRNLHIDLGDAGDQSRRATSIEDLGGGATYGHAHRKRWTRQTGTHDGAVWQGLLPFAETGAEQHHHAAGPGRVSTAVHCAILIERGA